MLRTSDPRWLLIALIILSTHPTLFPYQALSEAAIVKPEQILALKQARFESEASLAADEGEKHQAYSRQAPLPIAKSGRPNKFLMTADGTNIKLHPIREDNLTPSGGYYLVKVADIDVDAAIQRRYLTPNSSYTRWLRGRAQLKKSRGSGTANKPRVSILPTSKTELGLTDHDEDEELLYDGSSGWRKPWISDVGHFMLHKLLRIFWLDRRNKVYQIGNVPNVDELNLEMLNSSFGLASPMARSSGKVIRLENITSVDLCEAAARFDADLKDCEAFGMSSDNERLLVHFFLGARNSTAPSHVLSINTLSYLDLESVFSLVAFESCPKNTQGSNFKNTIKNVFMGNWFYYLDKDAGGKIMSVHVRRLPADDPDAPERPYVASQAPIVETRTVDEMEDKTASALVMTMDKRSCRLIWLMDNNELFSSNQAGNHVKLLGKLPPKPVIKCPDLMSVFDGTIFISDSCKRSVMAIRLADFDGEQQRLIHEVFLIESPAISGFSFIRTDWWITVDDPTHQCLFDTEAKSASESSLFAWFNSILDSEDSYNIYTQLEKRHDEYLENTCATPKPFEWTILMALSIGSVIGTIILVLYWRRKGKSLEVHEDKQPIAEY